MRMLPIFFALIMTLSFSATARELTGGCPAPPSLLRVEVSPRVDFDERTRLYGYHYKVTNSRASRQDVRLFGLEVGKDGIDVRSGSGWLGTFIADTRYAVWMSARADNTQPSASSFPKSKDQIKPGAAASFSLYSALPPGVVRYQALGWEQTPASNREPYADLVNLLGDDAASELWQEAIMEQCPAALEPTMSRGVLGTTIGPSSSISAEIIQVQNFISRPSLAAVQYAIRGNNAVDVREIDRDSIEISGVRIDPVELTITDIDGDRVNDLVLPLSLPAKLSSNCREAELFLSAKLHDRRVAGSMKNISAQCVDPGATFRVRVSE